MAVGVDRDPGSDSESARSHSPSPARSGTASPVQNNRSGSESPQQNHQSGSASPASNRSRSAGSNRSRSPGGSRSRSGSAQSVRSGSPNNRSPAASRSGSRSPAGSARSGGGSPSPKSPKSGSGSPKSAKSGSGSPRSHKSPSGSPKSRKSASPARSGSGTPKSNRSRSGTPKSNRSRSRTPKSHRSRSGTPHSHRARSGTPKSNNRSRSGTPKSHRSRSGSPKSNRSRSGTPKSHRSRSGSPIKNRSRSGTPKSNRSRSGSAKSNRSRSGSAKSNRSKSGSPKARSKSGSPKAGSGDDSDTGVGQKKRKRTVLSDESDGETKKKKDGSESGGDDNLVIDAGALFGDASDISDEEDGNEARKREGRSDGSEKGSDDEKKDEEADGTGEKEQISDEPVPETRIEVEIPKITTNLGKEIHFVKLPNFLSVETRPFDPETYEDEIDEEETLDEEGRARLKLKVENTIRWREVVGPQGTKQESNARFVRWSDGSMSLHLGSEIFDVYKQPLQGDHNHLFIRQGTGLQGQAVFRTKLSFRPHSTESFTHRKMTMSLADRSLKTSGIKMLSLVGKDPEAHRGEMIKKEEERLRATVRRESKQRRVREKGSRGSLSASYLEPDRYGDDDSDEEGISISAIKKQHKNRLLNPKGDRPNIYSSDEDASDIETRRARRLDKAKALKDSDEESGSGGGSD